MDQQRQQQNNPPMVADHIRNLVNEHREFLRQRRSQHVLESKLEKLRIVLQRLEEAAPVEGTWEAEDVGVDEESGGRECWKSAGASEWNAAVKAWERAREVQSDRVAVEIDDAALRAFLEDDEETMLLDGTWKGENAFVVDGSGAEDVLASLWYAEESVFGDGTWEGEHAFANHMSGAEYVLASLWYAEKTVFSDGTWEGELASAVEESGEEDAVASPAGAPSTVPMDAARGVLIGADAEEKEALEHLSGKQIIEMLAKQLDLLEDERVVLSQTSATDQAAEPSVVGSGRTLTTERPIGIGGSPVVSQSLLDAIVPVICLLLGAALCFGLGFGLFEADLARNVRALREKQRQEDELSAAKSALQQIEEEYQRQIDAQEQHAVELEENDVEITSAILRIRLQGLQMD